MQMFDPHVHMTSRTTDDYRAMAAAGIAAIVEPSFWLGQPRTHVGTFEDYFLSLVGWERFRARQFGIRHFCTIGLNPKEANNADVAPGVMELLPIYLEKDGVVAVGEIGFDDQTPAETRLWLHAKHPLLNNERAIDLILADRTQEVLAVMELRFLRYKTRRGDVCNLKVRQCQG